LPSIYYFIGIITKPAEVKGFGLCEDSTPLKNCDFDRILEGGSVSYRHLKFSLFSCDFAVIFLVFMG
jgi:hypothetical protein